MLSTLTGAAHLLTEVNGGHVGCGGAEGVLVGGLGIDYVETPLALVFLHDGLGEVGLLVQ